MNAINKIDTYFKNIIKCFLIYFVTLFSFFQRLLCTETVIYHFLYLLYNKLELMVVMSNKHQTKYSLPLTNHMAYMASEIVKRTGNKLNNNYE